MGTQLVKNLVSNFDRREPPMMEDYLNRIFENRKDENLVFSGEEEEEENLFDRLSDDLIVCNLFDKMPDSKCLFKCTLVCKRFSSLVYQVSTISLTLVPEKPNLAKRFSSWINIFFSRKDSFQPLVEVYEFKFFRQLVLNFFRNFTDLKYVNIEFDFLRKLRMEALCIWRLDSQSDSLVMLFAKNIDSGARVSDSVVRFYLSRARTRLAVIDLILSIVEVVSSWQTELKGVVFTDSEKQETLILDEKGILCMQNLTRNCREFSLRTWYEPKLELASSGRVMEDVMLLVFKGDDMVDDFLIAEKLGEGKEKLYSEAAIEMLKKEVKDQTLGRSEIFNFAFCD